MFISCFQIQTIKTITLLYNFPFYLPLSYDLLIKPLAIEIIT